MFDQTSPSESRSELSDWMGRGAIALFFIVEGGGKFGSGWTRLFQQIGLGQWFRYFTGVVEIVGGLLVLIPRATFVGLTLLAATMASAVLILTFQIHRPQDAVLSGAVLIGLLAFWWSRRN